MSATGSAGIGAHFTAVSAVREIIMSKKVSFIRIAPRIPLLIPPPPLQASFPEPILLSASAAVLSAS